MLEKEITRIILILGSISKGGCKAHVVISATFRIELLICRSHVVFIFRLSHSLILNLIIIIIINIIILGMHL